MTWVKSNPFQIPRPVVLLEHVSVIGQVHIGSKACVHGTTEQASEKVMIGMDGLNVHPNKSGHKDLWLFDV